MKLIIDMAKLEIPFQFSCTVTSGKTIREHPETVEKIVKAMANAVTSSRPTRKKRSGSWRNTPGERNPRFLRVPGRVLGASRRGFASHSRGVERYARRTGDLGFQSRQCQGAGYCRSALCRQLKKERLHRPTLRAHDDESQVMRRDRTRQEIGGPNESTFGSKSVFMAGVLLFSSWSVSAARAGSNAKIIEAATKEGAVSYYTTMTLSQSKKVVDKFEQKYPFIKPELFRGGGDEVLNRILNETRGGLNAWDVVSTRGDSVLTLRNAKLITSYRSPESNFVDRDMVDDEGYWTAYYVNPYVLGYNTKLVKKEEVPQNLRTAARSQVERKKNFYRRFGLRVSRRTYSRVGKRKGCRVLQEARRTGAGAPERQYESRATHDGGRISPDHRLRSDYSERNIQRTSHGLGASGTRCRFKSIR